jgi:hypothetical protein
MKTLENLNREVDDLWSFVWRKFGSSGSTAPASAWADSVAGNVSQGGGPAAIVAHASITPVATGKLRVWISGTIQNDSDSGQVQVTQSVGHGASVATIDYVGGTVEIEDNGGGREFATLSLSVDLDRSTTPITFPLNTPVQINAIITVLSGGQAVQWANHQIQIAVQERSA